MLKTLNCVCCFLLMEFITKTLSTRQPLDRSFQQKTKLVIPLTAITTEVLKSNSEQNVRNLPRKVVSTTRPSSYISRRQLKDTDKSEGRYSFTGGIDKNGRLSRNSHRVNDKIMHVRRTSKEPSRIKVIVDPNYSKYSPAVTVKYNRNFQEKPTSKRVKPIASYYFNPHLHSGKKAEDNLFDKQRHQTRSSLTSARENSKPYTFSTWNGRKEFNPPPINYLPSKPYSENPLSSTKEFKRVHKDPPISSTGYVNSKASHRLSQMLPRHGKSAVPDSKYKKVNFYHPNSGSNSSDEVRKPNNGNYELFKNSNNPQTKFRTELPKLSFLGNKYRELNSKPSFQTISVFGKQTSNFQLPINLEPVFEKRTLKLSPHFKQEESAPSNLLIEKSFSNPIVPLYQSPYRRHLENSNSRNFRSFDSEDSREISPYFDVPIKPLDENKNERPPINVPGYEVSHTNDRFQSKDKAFISRQEQFNKELSNRNPVPFTNLNSHKDYSSDEEEDILAARVKAILNPSGTNNTDEDQQHARIHQNLQLTNNHHKSNVVTERGISSEHATTSDGAHEIESLESDPEFESEQNGESDDVSGDKKDVFSEEQHDGFLDMGAYTDKQGSFGWYADFPVGRGHDKVSYSSSK